MLLNDFIIEDYIIMEGLLKKIIITGAATVAEPFMYMISVLNVTRTLSDKLFVPTSVDLC